MYSSQNIYSFIGFDEIVQMLLDKGAHLNDVDDQKNSALHYAAENGITILINLEFHQINDICNSKRYSQRMENNDFTQRISIVCTVQYFGFQLCKSATML